MPTATASCLVAPALDQRARRGAGDPARAAGAGGDLAVERHRGLVAHPRAAEPAVREVGGVLRRRPRRAGPASTSTPAARRRATPRRPRAGRGRGGDHDARDARGDQRVGAGRRAAVVGAGLEGDVGGGAARALPGGGERDGLGVRPPARSCQPSPTTSSPCAITQPTIGLGWVVPRPRSASSSARRRWRTSPSLGPRAGGGLAGAGVTLGSARGHAEPPARAAARCVLASFSHPDCHRRHPVRTGSGPGGLRRLGVAATLAPRHTAGRESHPAPKESRRPGARGRAAPAGARPWLCAADRNVGPCGRDRIIGTAAADTWPETGGGRPASAAGPAARSAVHSPHAHLRPEARQPRHPRAARGRQPAARPAPAAHRPVEAADLMRRIAAQAYDLGAAHVHVAVRRRADGPDPRPARAATSTLDVPDEEPRPPARWPSSSAATPTCASAAATPT
jgi:hypothetical protein